MHLAETERLLVLSIPSTVTGAAERRAQGQRRQTWEPDVGSHRGARQKKIGCSFGSHQTGSLCLWGGQHCHCGEHWADLATQQNSPPASRCISGLESSERGCSWYPRACTHTPVVLPSYEATLPHRGSQSLSAPLWALSATLWSIINSKQQASVNGLVPSWEGPDGKPMGCGSSCSTSSSFLQMS